MDTHVHRLSLRWGLSADERNVDKVQLDLHRQFPEEHWNKVHLQMIYFGREYCTAKLHVVSLINNLSSTFVGCRCIPISSSIST